jgi:Mn2+/Fe2+ NRAMP family transporter
MSQQTDQIEEVPPTRWKIVGPGLVVAATGVGAADMVATLVAGSRYGYALLWAVIVGVLLKIVLVEGAGRYTVATGRTIFQGWRSLGRWPLWYFGPYIVIWGFVYGATAMSSTALPLNALFGLSVPVGAILSGLLGLVLVWFGKYVLFERITAALVGVMFIVVVSLAVVATPNLPETVRGLVPLIPEGALFYTLAVAGGVGGTITLAAYCYWLREKGWARPAFLRVMRVDNTMAYVMTGIFVVAMLIVGAEVVRAAGLTLSSGDDGLLDLDKVLRDRYGDVIGIGFLVGFWAAAFTSILGVWNGVSLMFADFWAHLRGKDSEHPDAQINGKYFRFYLLWLTFPPMLLLLIGEPILLILIYGVLGALFMPFLAITLLPLLNTDRVPGEYRNKLRHNIMLVITAAIFIFLGAYQLYDTIAEAISGG